MTEQEKQEKVIANVTAIVSDMQEEVDEWKDYSDLELRNGLTCDCDWWYKTLQTLKDALALLKAQEQEIEDLKQDIEGHKDNLRETLDEMMRYADELKAQEPVKPSWRRGIPFCGKCGRHFADGFKYCPDCGREVKWE